MPIPISELRAAAARTQFSKAESLNEARRLGFRTAFLCHSHHDAVLAQGLVNRLAEEGCEVYVDWADKTMPETPNRETAAQIQLKIRQLDYFMFLATPNSTASRWCPWEIGYADGVKQPDNILLVTTTQGGQTYGNEYLELYRRIDLTSQNGLGASDPGKNRGMLVKSL